MSEIYARELGVAQGIARQAGEIMLRYFDGDQQPKVKEDGSPVTIADTEINRMVIERLQGAFPQDGVIGEEESTSDYGLGRKWLCDPIDGTRAYVWSLPMSMFSLGLVVDGVPQLGVAYDPYLQKMYRAVRGQGSFCNDQRIHVSSVEELSKSTIAISSNVKNLVVENPERIARLASAGAYLSVLHSAVYKSVLVARGTYAGYVEESVGPHDMAAVHVIVEEAGGSVTDLRGDMLRYDQPFKGAVVSNGIIHDELVNIVNK